MTSLPHDTAAWPNFHIGNHDQLRVATRHGTHMTDAWNMILMMLPGTPLTYYGDEIGMTNNEEMELITDHRDRAR